MMERNSFKSHFFHSPNEPTFFTKKKIVQYGETGNQKHPPKKKRSDFCPSSLWDQSSSISKKMFKPKIPKHLKVGDLII